MEKKVVTTSASPHIQLEVNGDLNLKGQETFEVTVKSDNPEDLVSEAIDDRVTIRCPADGNVRVPRAAIVQVTAVKGDAVIKALDGELNIDAVNGDLELRNVGITRIGKINGDLEARNVDGSLAIDSAQGDVSIRGVQGAFTVTTRVAGNLNLSDVGEDASASANGNVYLRLDPAPGHSYEFTSQGNVFCRLPPDASVEISVPKASKVMVELPGIHAPAPVHAPYALTLAEGDAKITLSAKGNVILDTYTPEWDTEDFDLNIDSEVNGMADAISQQITQQVESQVRLIEDQLDAQLSSISMRLNAAKISEEQARRIEERARKASERANARAQERIRHAQERMVHKLAAAQRKIESKAQAQERASRHSRQNWSFSFPAPPTPASPPGDPVSEDERLMILRMLEQKKITLEEAEELLSALEGKSA
jgi:flagellar biosynthesis GTPase FlhF